MATSGSCKYFYFYRDGRSSSKRNSGAVIDPVRSLAAPAVLIVAGKKV
jgi:hypothetical protein